MAVTPAEIAVALGRPTPTEQAALDQWAYWIAAAYRAVERRADRLGVDYATLAAADVDYVVTEAVAAQVRRPDDSTSVEVAVDDGRSVRCYSSSTGRVSIADDLWDSLGLLEVSESFTITPAGAPDPSPVESWA